MLVHEKFYSIEEGGIQSIFAIPSPANDALARKVVKVDIINDTLFSIYYFSIICQAYYFSFLHLVIYCTITRQNESILWHED